MEVATIGGLVPGATTTNSKVIDVELQEVSSDIPTKQELQSGDSKLIYIMVTVVCLMILGGTIGAALAFNFFGGSESSSGSPPPPLPPSPPPAPSPVRAVITFDLDFASVGPEGTATRSSFITDFENGIAGALGIGTNRLAVREVNPGEWFLFSHENRL